MAISLHAPSFPRTEANVLTVTEDLRAEDCGPRKDRAQSFCRGCLHVAYILMTGGSHGKSTGTCINVITLDQEKVLHRR